jgi:hypothetical protein
MPSWPSGQWPLSSRRAAATMTDSGSSDGALPAAGSTNGLCCGRWRVESHVSFVNSLGGRERREKRQDPGPVRALERVGRERGAYPSVTTIRLSG